MDWSWMHAVRPEHALVAAGVAVRLAVAVAVGGLPLTAGTSLQVRMAAVVAMAVAAWPSAAITASSATAPAAFVVVGEAIVGLGLGAALAAVFAAAGWAGTLLGSVSGLSWADDFTPEADSQSAGIARLAWWLGLAGFVAGGGHLQLAAGLIDSFRALPVGVVVGQGGGLAGVAALVSTAPGTGLGIALTLAGPTLAAVLAFHVAATVAVRIGRVDPGQGLLQSLASLVVLAGVCLAADAWTGGFAALVLPALERCFLDLRH
jgi:flagellar biosynthetic protein FliR